MRVNLYAEELTDRVEIISKEIDGQTFTGLRIYLELPVTLRVCRFCEMIDTPGATSKFCPGSGSSNDEHDFQPRNISGPFMHRPGDDDSSAMTFWGKSRLREILKKALEKLDEHYTKLGGKS
jgi:hypothetical protein